ncbi:MAG: TRAP transporter small permease subunit [Pseudomonadota bacterium]|nr:TRAP transporter small permease subunit [Pseudomonadota bacterium]
MTEPISSAAANRTIENVRRALDQSLGFVLAVIMFVMMILTFCDVVGRQGFDSPINGGTELTEISLGFVVYIGLPLVCIRREHITIGLMAGIFRGTALRVQHTLLNLIFAAATYIWARQVWVQAESLRNANSELMFLQISVAPFVFVMSIFTFFASACFLLLAWCYFRGAHPKSGERAG